MKISTWIVFFVGWAFWLTAMLILFAAERLGMHNGTLLPRVLIFSISAALVMTGGACQYCFQAAVEQTPLRAKRLVGPQIRRKMRCIITTTTALLAVFCLGVALITFTLWVDGKGLSFIKGNARTILFSIVSILIPFTSAMLVEHSLEKKGPPLPIRPPDQ